MFRAFRGFTDAVQSLVIVLQGLASLLSRHLKVQEASGTLRERVDDLERTRAQWEAQVEADMLKAESKYSSVRNAEERTRKMAKVYEAAGEGDEGGEDSGVAEALRQLILQGNVDTGEDQELPAVHPSLEFDGKSQALNAKWGV